MRLVLRLVRLGLLSVAAICNYGALLSSPTIVSNHIHFSFECATGERAVVQSAASIVHEWTAVAEFQGTGSPVDFAAPLSATARFFRVEFQGGDCCGPVLDLEPLVFKAGEPVETKLRADGGTAPLVWTARNLPAGMTLAADGTLSGTPTAEAAELDETGRYSVHVQVADSAGTVRQATNRFEVVVRLSYLLNIQAARTNGPSLRQNCSLCHSGDFKPDILSDANALINVLSGSGAECGTDRPYVSPGDASDSLIFEKLNSRNPCGERMPFGGPYLSDLQLNRLARWIRELTPDDRD